ncbi:MAG: hypothetical protein JW821_02775 [Deltaproteobacteria bacterium]|nr:hypothetical protein [Deltaproteobacteria bacterium]
MDTNDALSLEGFYREDSFGFIKQEDYEALGIDPEDIPPGTFAALKHPSQLPSRFGGNAYGFGIVEFYDRLKGKDLELLQTVNPEDPEGTRTYFREFNRIYKKIGLLKRYSRLGKPYYLIPVPLILSSLSRIRSKADEISKIIDFHRKKYLKESHKIGLVTHRDDLLINDLSLRFKEHQFIVLDSFQKLRSVGGILDLVVISRDFYEIFSMEKFVPRSRERVTRRHLECYFYYMLGKIYGLLKPDGEIFVIANVNALRSNQEISVTFKTEKEKKSFLLFAHVFKTRKKYRINGQTLKVNQFDFQRYLNAPYVEKEVLDKLCGDVSPEKMSVQDIDNLAYLNFPLDEGLPYDQAKSWARPLSVYFRKLFLKPVVPESIKKDWKKRFSAGHFVPDYMIAYLGQKRTLDATWADLQRDIVESRIAGSPLALVADYRDSFDYVIRTFEVLKRIRSGSYAGLPELFMERLKEPLENKKRRYTGLNDVLKLLSKVNRLERIRSYLNPDGIEGAKTQILKSLETLSLYGFTYGELKELALIVVGHTAMGRILSGKMNEKALKPVSDLARAFEPLQALNLLRYCRLMSMAETSASKKADLNQEELTELFDLYESMVKVVTNRDMDWDRLLDEKVSAMGGMHHKVVRKILKMMNLFQFIANWSELSAKGEMEKEALADYDAEQVAKIENVIRLVRIIEKFEDMYLKEDPLQISIFYRKFLNAEFHGTVHVFEKMDSEIVFLLIWITVNVARGEIINFNPLLSDVAASEIAAHISNLEGEAKSINIHYLDLDTLMGFSDQLDENGTAFVVGTGFQLKVNPKTQALDVVYTDINENVKRLDALTIRLAGTRISAIPVGDLESIESLFGNLEGFYQSHLRLIDRQELKLPERQKDWFEKVLRLREFLKENFIRTIFQPEDIFTDLDLLYRHSPSLLHFVLPEFMALRNLTLPGKVYLKASLIEHALTSVKKMQALIRREKGSFQDVQLLHKLAQREFGPMVAGIVGLNERQIETLERLMGQLRETPPLFDALIKSFVFRDLGLVPALREKHRDQMNPADHALAGALFLERERIPELYGMDERTSRYLLSLVRYHDLLHHIIRGEFSLYAIQDVINLRDKDFFDAFFVASFIMFSAMREDLILEDLAKRLFQLRGFCHRIIEGKITPEEHLTEVFLRNGHLFHALVSYQQNGLRENMAPSRHLDSFPWDESMRDAYIQEGRRVYALERIFRLRGIRYVEFPDLANLMIKVPLKFIYKRRHYSGIGYATFERELFEALRLYNGLHMLPENIRHFIYEHLVCDEVRIFGFENVTSFLSYENMIKLLFIALQGSREFKKGKGPICLDFLDMAEKIEKRYEAVNDTLSQVSVRKMWSDQIPLNSMFRAKTGIILRRHQEKRVLSIDFADRINISQKLSYLETINDVEQLKNYFHYSLQNLRKNPFYTEDYERLLEKAYEKRLGDITDQMLERLKRQMGLLRDFREIHALFVDLVDRSLDIGFSEEQRHRLSDIYELRKDDLKREKLEEINRYLDTIHDVHELKEYWDSIKWYLLNNRQFTGKEFENLIARKFDETMAKLSEG